jgi:uncharacterized protein YhaN
VRIEGWKVDGFGVLSDMHVDGLGPGVTVFLGDNEAGKSTLLAFIRAMLFGFPDRRTRENLYPPLSGGRHGGSLILVDGPDRWTLTRYSDKRRVVTLSSADGGAGGEDDLRRLLAGVDANLFRSVFAFSLNELQQFESLDAEGVRERIFSVGISGAGQSARTVLKHLGDHEARLLKQRGGQAIINDLVRQIQTTEDEVRRAAGEAHRYTELLEVQAEQDRLVAEKDVAIAALTAERRRYETLLALRPDWEELAATESALEETAHISLPSLPHTVGELLTRLNALRSREEALEGLQADAAQAQADLDDRIRLLGPEWTIERLLAVDGSLVERDAVKELRRRLTSATSAVDTAEREAATACEQLADLTHDHDRCRAELPDTNPPSAASLSDSEAALRGLRTQLHELRMAEFQAAQPQRRERRRLGRPALVAAAIIVAAAIGAALLGWVELALGLGLGSLVTLLIAMLDHRGAAAGEDDQPRPLDRLRAEIASSAALLDLPERPTEADVSALEARLADRRAQRVACDGTERQVGELALKVDHARSRAARLEQAATVARDERQDATAIWSGWVKQRGLPAASPDCILEILDHADAARSIRQSLEKARRRIEAIQVERHGWTEDARTALELAGHHSEHIVSAKQTETALASLSEPLALRGEALRRHDEHERRIRQGLSPLPDPEGARRELVSGDPRVWQTRVALLEDEVAQAGDTKTQAIEMRRDAQRAREALETSADLSALQGELESLRARLTRAVHEYQVNVVASGLVRTTLQTYVRERQPAVLERASAAFAQVTDGRYRAVVQVAAAEDDTLMAERWDGERLAPEALSRGTCEQLYLAIRLALAGEFAAQGRDLPLIMDDCLVNFDPGRAAAMANAIATSAITGQCLFFTCHPAVAELMHSAGGDTATLIHLPRRGAREELTTQLPLTPA